MTAPVTGPYEEVRITKGPPNIYGFKPDWVYRRRIWYRQRKPYNLPLSYDLQFYRVVSSTSNDGTDVDYYYGGNNGLNDSLVLEAYNKAYSKFRAKLGEGAELGVSLAERKQAMDMMTARLLQLGRFARSLRRLDFQGAAKELGDSVVRSERFKKLSREQRFKRHGKAFGDTFLEFHFGWSPLVNDIGNAIDVLQGEIPNVHVKVRAASQLLKWSNVISDNLPAQYWREDFREQCWCEIGSDVRQTNPNLWLANQLGFVNPATLLWEVVPFSFVVDWFVNVSDFLSGFSDFAGVELTNTYRTFKQKSQKFSVYQAAPTRLHDAVWEGLDIARRPGSLPGPSLRVKPAKALSPSRGLTAISLLLQQLR